MADVLGRLARYPSSSDCIRSGSSSPATCPTNGSWSTIRRRPSTTGVSLFTLQVVARRPGVALGYGGWFRHADRASAATRSVSMLQYRRQSGLSQATEQVR
jgi:hypothetical protein